jgi:hypothetical protein
MWKSIFVKVILVFVLSLFLVQFSVSSALAHNAPDIDRKLTKNRPLPELPDLSPSDEVLDFSVREVLPNSPAEASPKGVEDLSTRFLRIRPQANQAYDLQEMKKFDDELYGDEK